jgi:Holliday junction resolvasome RuvABC DNA-binding subunit
MIELRARLELPEAASARARGDDPRPRVEVREALTTLGYAPEEIRAVLGKLPDDGSVEELLRSALRELGVRT